MKFEKQLYLTVGIPGSGKSTTAKKLISSTNGIYLNMDSIRKELTGTETDQSQNYKVYMTFIDRLKSALKTGKPIIVDNTNYNSKNRKDTIKTAKEFGYKVFAFEMNTPHNVSKERNRNRDRVVPDEVVDRMIQNYQSPSSDEGIDKIYKIG